MVLLKKIKNVVVLILKILYLNIYSKGIKKKNHILIIPEFNTEGGTLTYFKYIIEYFDYNAINYILVLTKDQKVFVEKNLKMRHCINVIEGLDVWRPYFSKRNKIFHNLDLFINQLQELLFFSRLNIKFKPKYFYFSVANPEHYLFEFCMPAKIFYVCHTLTYDKLDIVKRKILHSFIGKKKQIIVVSEFAKHKMIESWNIKAKEIRRIFVIYNYYESFGHHLKSKSARQSINLLTIGSLEDFKNPLLWCDVAKRLTILNRCLNIHFYWVGNGSLLAECKQRVKGFNNIHFEGYSDNVEFYYSIADIYMQPSKTESFGISVAGAMFHKIPCIVSNAGGLRELVLDYETGFIIREQLVDSYTEKVEALLANHSKSVEMGEQGYYRYINNFTKLHWIHKMNSLLNK